MNWTPPPLPAGAAANQTEEPSTPPASSHAAAQHKSKNGVTSITAYDHQYQQREIYVPNTKVGLVIGKGGSHVVYFQHQSGAAIHIARESDEIPGGG